MAALGAVDDVNYVDYCHVGHSVQRHFIALKRQPVIA